MFDYYSNPHELMTNSQKTIDIFLLIFKTIKRSNRIMFKTLYPDFPFECKLTKWCEDEILEDQSYDIISGFTNGQIVGCQGDIFFKAAFPFPVYRSMTEYSMEYHYVNCIYNEEKCLELLSEYDFIPQLICRKKYTNYIVVFMKIIDGTSLDKLSINNPVWKLAVSQAFEYLIKLYKEKQFVHGDMDPNNIMINNNGDVYIIDFSTGSFDYTKSWTIDLSKFIFRIIDKINMPDELRFRLKNFSLTLDVNDIQVDTYSNAVKKFLSLLE